MAPVTHPDRYSESIDFWRNVYGIDISAMLPLAKQCAFEEPSVETINGENVLTWPHVVKHADCYTITIQVLESVTTRFKFQSMMRAPFHGFAFWFDVEFSGPEIYPANSNAPSLQSSSNHSIESRQRRKRANPNEALVLSTALEDPPTHWQQIYPNIDLDSNRSGGRSFVRVSNAMILLENFLMASLVLVLVLVLVRWSPSLPPSIDGCCVVFASEPNCMCKGFHRFLP